MSPESFYALKTTTLAGQPADLAQYKGKVAVVVNVASKCGYTPQYTGLEKLYEDYKDKGVVVLGFPSNDFGGQEPGTPEEIADFCKKNYGVSFPLFSKVVTKAGGGAVARLLLPGCERPASFLELRQVRGREGRQGGGFLPEQGHPGVEGAARRHRRRPRPIGSPAGA